MLGLTVIPSLVGLPALGIGVAHMANGWRDPHPAEQSLAPVLSKRENEGDYYLTLGPSSDGLLEAMEVEVEKSLWSRLSGGEPVRVQSRAGRLGWRWYGEVEAAPPER
jgi:hypothetical protein